MGLDMSIARRNYVKNWNHDKEHRYTISVKRNGKKSEIDPKKITYIEEEVARWRKANAIHKWFVKNVQGGEDDCRDYSVSEEQLRELIETCETVIVASELVKGKIKNGYTYDKKGRRTPIMEVGKYIKDPTVAEHLLPTTDGFFFGSTDYDEWYYEDLVDTVRQLKEALKTKGECADYVYRSSW